MKACYVARQTKVYRTLVLMFCTSLVLLTACHSPATAISLERDNPEFVLRSYFDAWARNDQQARASFVSDKYGSEFIEPVESLKILSLSVTDDRSLSKRVYSVSFEVKFKGGRSHSMEDGRYNWTYTLEWNKARDSWLITNYGAG